MKIERVSTAIILPDLIINERPFVNEECGDTMWDVVLINTEGKHNEK
jgi:hypothetical protein